MRAIPARKAALFYDQPRSVRPSAAPWGWLALLFWASLSVPSPARGQDEIRFFHGKPILVADTGGPRAPVRSLVWQDDFTLLSGGEDKVVRVWGLNDGTRLVRTIRPMIWRGLAGSIFALALSPKPVDDQSLLAVGGWGIESARGDMTVFRVPGVNRGLTGEVVARLRPRSAADPQASGHSNSVTCLAFDPTGRVLASGSFDNSIILWDWDGQTFRPRKPFLGHTRAVQALAFSPDGGRLASGGADGSLRIWDVRGGAALYARTGDAARPDSINTLVYRPDGDEIVVGLEGGAVYRFDIRNLAQVAVIKLETRQEQGPVEAAAFASDGKMLAISIKSDKADALDPMSLACDLELRAWPGGNIVHQRRVPGLVRALAFGPGNRLLAYSGGPAQAIYLQDMRALESPPRELKGQGSTPFDLGFTADSQVIGFTRERHAPANPPQVYDAFDVGKRRSVPVIPRDQLRRAIKEYQGWTLDGSINNYRLELVHGDGRRRMISLDRQSEQLWWSWSFVPPGPEHPRATVAIGTATGIAIFDLETGQRTRVLAGHGSAVVSVVPSPDGRWLASSSLDQNIMFYPLAGCDTRPGLGASFQERPAGTWTVAKVERRSFAAAMGLRVGDVVVQAGTGHGGEIKRYTTPAEIAEFVKLVDGLEPYVYNIGIRIRRTLDIPTIGRGVVRDILPSTKRNNPALTLLLGADNEWVLWTPQGYYDTSIEGDTRLLGWQTNPRHDSVGPTDFVPIATYAARMNRPEVLERVWGTGDLEQAAAVLPPASPAPEALAAENQPPQIVFAAVERGTRLPSPGLVWSVSFPRPKISVRISSGGKSRISARRVIFDERRIDRNQIPRPVPDWPEELELELVPNRRTRLAVEATNERGSRRTETIDLIYTPPPPPVQPPTPPPAPVQPPAPPPRRLFVLSVGTEKFSSSELPPVRYADKDASDLATSFARRLVSSDGTRTKAQEPTVITGIRASTQSVAGALDHLQGMLHSNQVNQGDVVAVVLAVHILSQKGSTSMATTDSQPLDPIKPAVPTRELCDVLGQLADYGCRVVVFLDGVHRLKEPLTSEIKPLVRELSQKRRVITFVASKEGPSGVDDQAGHGLFALGLQRAFQTGDLAGARPDRRAVYTLDQFKTALRDTVLSLSQRRQEAFCYIPLEVLERTPFALPEP
jgi:WD40 repeat protein